MANYHPVLPSVPTCIVQGSASVSAVRFATILLPGLYNRSVCHLFYLTGLSVGKISPNAMFPGAPLDIRFAVREHSDLPCRLRWIVGKSGVFNRYNTL